MDQVGSGQVASGLMCLDQVGSGEVGLGQAGLDQIGYHQDEMIRFLEQFDKRLG